MPKEAAREPLLRRGAHYVRANKRQVLGEFVAYDLKAYKRTSMGESGKRKGIQTELEESRRLSTLKQIQITKTQRKR